MFDELDSGLSLLCQVGDDVIRPCKICEGRQIRIINVFLSLDCEKMAAYAKEERHIKEENIRLQRKLLREMERREALSRQLSESESSLEMDDER